MATPVSGAETWILLNNQPLSFQPDTENRHIGVEEYRTSYFNTIPTAPQRMDLYIDNEKWSTQHQGRWRWEPKDHAGLYKIRIQAPGIAPLETRVRVFAQKLLLPAYERMQQELSDISVELLLKIWSYTSEKALPEGSARDTSPLHDYELTRALIQQIPAILAHISQQPHSALQEYCEEVPYAMVRDFSYEVQPIEGKVVTLPAEIANICGLEEIPAQWQISSSKLSYDVYENRLLKAFLRKQLVSKISIIQRRAEQELMSRTARSRRSTSHEAVRIITRLRFIIDDCKVMKRRCLKWSDEPFLHDVSVEAGLTQATQVLLKNPSYSRFYRLYLQFQQRLKVNIDTEYYATELAMRKVSDQYEMWSIFLATRWMIDLLLEQGYSFVSQTIFYEVDRNHFQFDVRRNSSSIILKRGETRVIMKYEPVYRNYQDVTEPDIVSDKNGSPYLTPDMAIEVYEQDILHNVIIFDAKYRRERGHNGKYHPKSEDINTMNMYTTSIVYKPSTDPVIPLQSIVSSAYIFFPGHDVSHNARHSVGGIPMMPHVRDSQTRDLEREIRDAKTALEELLVRGQILTDSIRREE